MRRWLAAATLLAACGPAQPATFTEVYAALFPRETRAQCSLCHGLPPNEISNGLLSMGTDRATAYAALTTQASKSKRCSGRAFVVAGNPDASLLYEKVSPAPPCGDRMPLGGSVLSSTQLELVRSWIAAGARDD